MSYRSRKWWVAVSICTLMGCGLPQSKSTEPSSHVTQFADLYLAPLQTPLWPGLQRGQYATWQKGQKSFTLGVVQARPRIILEYTVEPADAPSQEVWIRLVCSSEGVVDRATAFSPGGSSSPMRVGHAMMATPTDTVRLVVLSKTISQERLVIREGISVLAQRWDIREKDRFTEVETSRVVWFGPGLPIHPEFVTGDDAGRSVAVVKGPDGSMVDLGFDYKSRMP